MRVLLLSFHELTVCIETVYNAGVVVEAYELESLKRRPFFEDLRSKPDHRSVVLDSQVMTFILWPYTGINTPYPSLDRASRGVELLRV